MQLAHAKDLPHAREVILAWRGNHIAWGSIRIYLRWAQRCHEDCQRRGLVMLEQLTEDAVRRWATGYLRSHRTLSGNNKRVIHTALWAWSWGSDACGYAVPPWSSPPSPPAVLPDLQEAFVKHRREVRGVSEATIRRDLGTVEEFLSFLRRRRRRIVQVQVTDVDAFMTKCSHRLAGKTLSRVAYVLRAFLRFLFVSGHIRHDLADAVAAPKVRRGDQPSRALPWADVRRIFKAIDKTARSGRRDYALLLMMAAYGLGAGEVCGLRLESVDWRRQQLQVVRPKTGRVICLPLLPAVARVLTAYLRRGRPLHCMSRALFVQMQAPYGPLGGSGAIRHILQKHASHAGVISDFLGSHVLRHSHACRQIDLGASATVVGDILGHRRPESTSAYVKVALRRLRTMALPVPK